MSHFAPVALLGLLLAGGCASPSASGPVASPASAESLPALRKGLPAAEVKALMGEPREVRPYVVQGIESEIWVYKRRIPGGVRQVVVRMQEVPFVDPITGTARMIQEPVQEQETTVIVETTELLMFAGAVAEWRQFRDAERSIN